MSRKIKSPITLEQLDLINNNGNKKNGNVEFNDIVLKVKPLTKHQELFINAIETSCLTIAVGPAGVGKDYISCYCALKLLIENKIDKIILTRPVVESGERIGFLPGSDLEKIRPYLSPMLDCFEEFVGEKILDSLIKDKKIQLRAFAYMRGADFKNSVVIADEVQNCNTILLKMLLTRIGKNCRMVLLADHTQSDLRYEKDDLMNMIAKLQPLIDSSQISYIRFNSDDIVRSGIVKEIVKLLEK